MTNKQILNAYIHKDKSDKEVFNAVEMLKDQAEAQTILTNWRPRHQWTETDFNTFAANVRKLAKPVTV
jgi:hypothetical protein